MWELLKGTIAMRPYNYSTSRESIMSCPSIWIPVASTYRTVRQNVPEPF